MNNKRVLLVDDDDGVAEILVELIQSTGYKVTRTRCGDDAIDMLELSHCGVGLVVTDLYMPNGNGLKVKKYAESLGLKVLVLSGLAHAYSPVMSTSAIMSKPWDNDALLRVIKTAMSSADGIIGE